ncbi:hypothetical protein VY88_32610 [Azospirillum thiophilum]|uniref:DUF1640 domain-containing protein n=1 Tax=Azospirillum thiophilum TaxID=528244 RepID=A0AAC8ZUZ0_9PROT|nr:hypothetical protein [Azospirillum thiophilum]ALG73104.1 hypothetical protein AL072_15325 [Azospirillum thiophilum]KJR61426.1 hypothetical protein VY88_32610 [Azospirillum thiophilum]
MSAVPFDTLRFATKLQAGGFSVEQARAAAEAFAEATSEEIATKSDIAALRTGLGNDMQIMERDLKIWFGKMMAWQLTAIAGLLGIATAIVKFV